MVGRLKRVTVIFAGLAGLIIVSWVGREALFEKAASFWIVSHSMTQADAIVVLGGNEARAIIAADLHKRGFARKILVSQTADRAVLVKLGILPDHIASFGTANTNTRDEAVALRKWAQTNSVSAFIIPTEIFFARRVRWIFHRMFSGSDIRIEVSSFEPPDYRRKEWWKNEQGVTAFRNEVMKYLYYRMNY